MRSDSARRLRAGLVSAVLLGVVLWLADPGEIDLSVIAAGPLLGCVAGYLGVLALRGLTYRSLCTRAPARSAGLPRWIALAARHQLVFTLAPSGAGDLAFPLLAARFTGLGKGAGVGLIAGARLRDVCVLSGLGVLGLAGAGVVPGWAGLLALPAAVGLYQGEWAVRRVGRVAARLVPRLAAGARRRMTPPCPTARGGARLRRSCRSRYGSRPQPP